MSYTSEREIENDVLQHRADIGYPDAAVIRNVRLIGRSGLLDIMLLPASGLHRLVLVEVKRSTATEAADKVVGQLLKYYAFALTLGTRGIEEFRRYANEHPTDAESDRRTKPLDFIVGPKQKRLERLREGRRIRPQEIKLYVALDGEVRDELKQILGALSVYHQLHIGVVKVDKSQVRVLAGSDQTVRVEF